MSRPVVVPIASFLLCAANAAADPATAIARANILLDQRDWYAAFQVLEAERPSCAVAGAAKHCLARIDFALGYARERAAREDPGETSVGLLRASLDSYDAVLSDFPDDVDALKNRMFVEQQVGDTDRVIASLTRLAEVDRANAGAYLVMLGDVQRDAGNRAAAFAAYRLAADRAPKEDLAWQRVLTLQPREGLPALAARLRELGHMTLVLGALEAILRGSTAAPEATLVEWVELRAARGPLSAADVEAVLNPSWPATRDLVVALKAPEATPTASWWTQSPMRRHAIGRALARAAETAVAKGDPARAALILERALGIAPDVMQYSSPELRGKDNVTIDIALQLARIDHLHPQLDPGQVRFQRLTNELFGEKMTAYLQADLEAIERIHTVLGIIYAERGVWTGFGYKTAMYQLEHAIKAAEKRRAAAPTAAAPPIPHIHALYAECLRRASKPGEAEAQMVEAAAGYLDLDDVDTAVKALDEAGVAGTRPRGKSLRAIAESRRSIGALEAASFDAGAATFVERTDAFAWLGAPLPGIDGPFLDRQRFKALSDLGGRAAEVEKDDMATAFRSRAYELAGRQSVLPSAGDVLRLQKIDRKLRPVV